MKNQIDWIPLSIGAVRPTQGRTLAVMQVSGGSLTRDAWDFLVDRYSEQKVQKIKVDLQKIQRSNI